MVSSKERISKLFALADIKINGNRPWDIRVHDERFYKRMLSDGSLGFGESYMDGWWDCPKLDECTFRLLRANLRDKFKPNLKLMLSVLAAKIINQQTKRRAARNSKRHYDIGRDLYKAMLGKRMVYTNAYWKNSKNLDDAQEAKLDLICKKIGLKPGMKLLDIGCGWGGLVYHAAKKYGAKAVGITVSPEHVQYSKELCKGLPVEIRLQDYRDINEKFDCIASVEMIEHVGYKNHRKFMEVAHRCLKDAGLFLLQVIGSNISTKRADPWTDKYIFPGVVVPSMAQLGTATEGLFVTEDVHNFGSDYSKTLMGWWNNFNKNYDKLKSKYDERFYRMWKFYLVGGSGMARSRDTQVWQIVYSKNGVLGGYNAVR